MRHVFANISIQAHVPTVKQYLSAATATAAMPENPPQVAKWQGF
jgi:hypothetical protein